MSEKSEKRTKRTKKNVIAMIGIKGITMAISFLYVPLLLNTLQTAEYAIWLTLTSLVAWVAMFDVGLGNGLRNKLSEALANEDIIKGKHLVSTAYCVIFVFAISLCVLFLLLNPFISWQDVLNNNTNIPGLETLIPIVFIAFCMQFALSLINSILFALQMPAISSMIMAISQMISFITVCILIKVFSVSSLLIIGTSISLIPPLTLLISTIIIFSKKYSNISPSIKYFDSKYIKEIFSLGVIFFILQIITLILYQTNNIIIIHIVDDEAVVQYNIAYKYMHVLAMLFTIIVTPIWSASTEAYALGDMKWIKDICNKLIKIALIFSMVGILMTFCSKFVYLIWTQDKNLSISYITTGLLMLQSIAFIFYNCYGYILNGMGKLRIQLICTSALAILYIPAAIFLGNKFGLNGILMAFAMNAIMNVVWSKIQFTKIINGTATNIWLK